MARPKRSRRSYVAGERGRNWVRIFPIPRPVCSGSSGARTTSAHEVAAGFARPELNGQKYAEPEPLTLEGLFDICREEVTPPRVGGAEVRPTDDGDVRPVLRKEPETHHSFPTQLGIGSSASGALAG